MPAVDDTPGLVLEACLLLEAAEARRRGPVRPLRRTARTNARRKMPPGQREMSSDSSPSSRGSETLVLSEMVLSVSSRRSRSARRYAPSVVVSSISSKTLVVRRVLGEYALLKGRLQADPSVYSGPRATVPRAAAGLVAGMCARPRATAGVPARPRNAVAPLSQMTDSLTADVAAIVKGFRGQMGVAAINLRTGADGRVGADSRFPTASTIKTAVMVEAWQQAADGRLTMETTVPLEARHKVGGAGVLRSLRDGLPLSVADLVHLMIVLSDNTATNMLIEKRRHRPRQRRSRAPRPPRDQAVSPDVPRRPSRRPAGARTRVRPRHDDAARHGAADGAHRRGQGGEQGGVGSDAGDAAAPAGSRDDPARDPTATASRSATRPAPTRRSSRSPTAASATCAATPRSSPVPNLSYVIAIHARQVEDMRWGIDNDALVTGARISQTIFDAFSQSRGAVIVAGRGAMIPAGLKPRPRTRSAKLQLRESLEQRAA